MHCSFSKLILLTTFLVLLLLPAHAISEPVDADSVTFALGHVTADPGDTIVLPFSINTVVDVAAYNFLFSTESGSIEPLALDATGTRGEGLPVFISGFGGSTSEEIAGVVAFNAGVFIPAGDGPVNQLIAETDGSIDEGSLLALTFFDEETIAGRKNTISDTLAEEHLPCYNNGSVHFLLKWDGMILDDWGDVNTDGIAYTVGDFVYFSNQLTVGLDQGGSNYEEGTENSDVDFDKLPWTVSDFLTIRGVISGDLIPMEADSVFDVIHNPGDSIWFDSFFGTQPDTLDIPMYISNEDSAGSLTFSMDFDSTEIEIVGINSAGSRLPMEWDLVVSPRAEGLSFFASPGDYQDAKSSPLEPGSGLLVTLRFAVHYPTSEVLDLTLTRLQNHGRINGYATWKDSRWNLASLQNKERRIEFAFIRGDANGSGSIDIDDIVFLIEYVFNGGPAPTPTDRGDFDGNLTIDIDDIVALINFVFG